MLFRKREHGKRRRIRKLRLLALLVVLILVSAASFSAGLITAIAGQLPSLDPRRAQAGDLSGGQQKQVEFAKAWLQQPALCLIDEPSIGLSPLLAEEVFTWIEKFAQAGMGILLIDHNVRRVVKMSDRVHVLSLGRITAAGERKDFEGDLHEQVKQWLGLNF